MVGDPPGIDYRNQPALGIGLLRRYRDLGLSASLDAARSVTPIQPDRWAVELNGSAMTWLGRENLVGIGAGIGLNRVSIDYSAYLQWLRFFSGP